MPAPAIRVPSYNLAFLPRLQKMTKEEFLAFAESKLEKGLLWAGSDDGLVNVTRDGGRRSLDADRVEARVGHAADGGAADDGRDADDRRRGRGERVAHPGHLQDRADRDDRVRAERDRGVDRRGPPRHAQTEPPPDPAAGTAGTGSGLAYRILESGYQLQISAMPIPKIQVKKAAQRNQKRASGAMYFDTAGLSSAGISGIFRIWTKLK